MSLIVILMMLDGKLVILDDLEIFSQINQGTGGKISTDRQSPKGCRNKFPPLGHVQVCALEVREYSNKAARCPTQSWSASQSMNQSHKGDARSRTYTQLVVLNEFP